MAARVKHPKGGCKIQRRYCSTQEGDGPIAIGRCGKPPKPKAAASNTKKGKKDNRGKGQSKRGREGKK
jgi:hypothetical protein